MNITCSLVAIFMFPHNINNEDIFWIFNLLKSMSQDH